MQMFMKSLDKLADKRKKAETSAVLILMSFNLKINILYLL